MLMKMTYIGIAILAYFLTDTQNCKKFPKANVNNKESVFSKDKQIN